MKRLLDPHQFKSLIFFLLLAIIGVVIFRVVWYVDVIFGWMGQFIFAIQPFIWGFAISYALNIPRERIELILERLSSTVNPAKPARPGSAYSRKPLQRLSNYIVRRKRAFSGFIARHRPLRYLCDFILRCKRISDAFVMRRKRVLSVVLVYIATILVIVLVANIIVPPIYESIIDFVNFLPTLLLIIESHIMELDANDAIPFFEIENFSLDYIQEFILGAFSMENVTGLLGTLVSGAGFIFRLALAIISSVYFQIEGPKFKQFMARVMRTILSTNFHSVFMKYAHNVNDYFKRYIRCQVLDALILGIIMTVVTSILGAEYALVIGPMLGVANLIPYFGSIVGTIAAIIIIMATDGFTLGIVSAFVLLAVQQLDANFIFPRLLGGSMKVSPLLVIIAIAIGNFYAGIIGMIVAIPIITVLKNIFDDILLSIEEKRHLRREGGKE